MRFPGARIAKHYFPVPRRSGPEVRPEVRAPTWRLLGLDQVLVDVEVHAPRAFVEQLGLTVGESVGLDDDDFAELLDRVEQEGLNCRYTPGGTVANTLNNYTHLSGEPAVLLGAIEEAIRPGSPAFHFVAQTDKTVDLRHLVGVDGPVGTAITFISPDGERSFAVAAGCSTRYTAEHLPDDLEDAAAVVASLYTVADPAWPITGATLAMMERANAAGVPVAFGLGTAGLVRRLRPFVRELLQQHVTIAAMNNREAEALTDEEDALLACQQALDWVDLVIVTEGPEGMTIGGYVDAGSSRRTGEEVRSKSIPRYNQWEFSRLMRRDDCAEPLKIYTHIHPYRGGPDRMSNTSGAGDAALAAILHDVAANQYHRATVPGSAKHQGPPFLTYSSLSRNAQYGNRVAYEVLKGFSPRLASPVGSDVQEADD